MVKHTCEVCDLIYSNLNDAKRCESKGIIGPEIEPGLLFINKKTNWGFLVFYKELKPEKHEKTYHFEEFTYFPPNLREIVTFNNLKIKSSDIEKKLGSDYLLATNEELDKLNNCIKNKFVENTYKLSKMMEEYGIKKLHNTLETQNLNISP